MSKVKSFRNKNRLTMFILVVVFIAYNLIIYTQGTSNNNPKMSAMAIKGQQLYQDNNCTACHQFYGLGGYLGPDLTNVISTKGKGELYVKAFLNSGIKTMPKFNFSEEEKNALVAFLTVVDESGYYPNHEGEKQLNGMMNLKFKQYEE